MNESKPSILIVDDNVASLAYLEAILKPFNINIIRAISGLEALSRIKNVDLALALLDIQMPEMDGIELAEIIQGEPGRDLVPIIFLTAYYQDELQLEKCYQSGAVDFFQKPFKKYILESKIRVFLELFRQKTQLFESEKKFHTLVEQSLQGLIVLKDFRIIFTNGSFVKTTGYSENELLGMSSGEVRKLISPVNAYPNWVDVKTGDADAILLGTNDFAGIRKDGTVIWLTVYANRVDFGGRPALQLVVIDITQQKKAEHALRESEAMYRTLLNASPEGIVIMDLKRNITELSEIALDILGNRDKSKITGRSFFDFIPGNKIRDLVGNTVLDGLVHNAEVIIVKSDQSQLICEISVTMINDPEGQPMSLMAIIRDVSERKKLEQQINHAERMAVLGEMASGIAHEINQPLNTISLSLENLLNEINKKAIIDDKYFRNKSEKIFSNIIRIGNIIDHVRVFSREHNDYILTAFNLNESIRNAISLISEQFRNYNIRLILELDESIPQIIGNTYKFEQVILNIIINAKDAVEEKARTNKDDFQKTIEISSFKQDHCDIVEIKDNGSGIKPGEIDKIMLPFYTTKDTGKGTGLGLSISFGIIREMNGNIEVSSELSAGTKFKILLPVESN